jgi:hypothetical protein
MTLLLIVVALVTRAAAGDGDDVVSLLEGVARYRCCTQPTVATRASEGFREHS